MTLPGFNAEESLYQINDPINKYNQIYRSNFVLEDQGIVTSSLPSECSEQPIPPQIWTDKECYGVVAVCTDKCKTYLGRVISGSPYVCGGCIGIPGGFPI